MSTKLNIFSVAINTESKQETFENIEKLLLQNRQCKIFTPNTEMLLAARRDPSLASLINSADLLLPDGIGIKIASHMLGSPIPERISGIDTAEEILTLAASRELSVFLLGGKHGVAEAAAEHLIAAHRFLNVCGAHHGYFDKDGTENRAVLEKINRARPDILFVCFGFPIQERWICENLPSLPSVRLAIGLGGSLDVWSGKKKRAPKIVQRLCLEWLWRATLEPRRLKILLEIPKFLFLTARERKLSYLN